MLSASVRVGKVCQRGERGVREEIPNRACTPYPKAVNPCPPSWCYEINFSSPISIIRELVGIGVAKGRDFREWPGMEHLDRLCHSKDTWPLESITGRVNWDVWQQFPSSSQTLWQSMVHVTGNRSKEMICESDSRRPGNL